MPGVGAFSLIPQAGQWYDPVTMPTLDFKGKQLIYAHHLSTPAKPLEVDAKKSLPPKGKKPSLDDNLIIHGDNLHALKALMPRYAGRVNCIYIDPPYNTGNEGWVYNDNVNSPMMKEWLKGKSPVDGEDLERHDKWLCMMWPRLHLLRELLAEDGVIFVNIDSNEHHRIRLILDEIFGEYNFRNEIVVRRGTKNVQSQFETIDSLATGHDTVLVYSKEKDTRLPKLQEAGVGDEPGKWDTFWRNTNRPTMRYTIFGQTPDNGQWRWRESRTHMAIGNYEEYLENYEDQMSLDDYFRIRLQERGQAPDFVRLGPSNKVQYYVGPRNYKVMSDVWMNVRTSGSLTNFPHEKHVHQLTRIIRWVTGKDSVVLDSFSGSGTTAHAALALNKEDGGNRKFILVECEGYANKITAERVRRVIKGIPKAKDDNLKKGLGGSFTYCTLGDEVNAENMLTGKNLPDYETLARHLYWTATGQSPDKIRKQRGKDGFFYETKGRLFYLIYEPKLAFLRSPESALNSDRAARIAKQAKTKKKTAIVFATHKFIGQKELTSMGIIFCGLPYGV